MEELTIHTDGGARGNPGPAACSFVINNADTLIKEGSSFLGNTTNNVAEYEGVISALNWIILNQTILNNFTRLNFILDSELIVRQINGNYKVRDEKLIKLHSHTLQLLAKINKTTIFRSVPRSQNKRADQLLNDELDNHK